LVGSWDWFLGILGTFGRFLGLVPGNLRNLYPWTKIS